MMEFDPDVAMDYATALIGGGLPSSYHLASAIARGDTEEALYYAKRGCSDWNTVHYVEIFELVFTKKCNEFSSFA